MKTQTETAPSPRQILNDQGVRRIPGRNSLKILSTDFKIATWNVRSLFEAGKLANACHEMRRLGIQILGLSEVRWPGSGKVKTMNRTLYYSGNDHPDHRNGVGVILEDKYNDAVTNFVPFSDRCLLIQLSGKPININIIQTYAPTADKSTVELETWYSEVEKLIKMTKKQDLTFILGDFNAKLGKGEASGLVGNFGLGERNDRGERMIEFCQQYNMVVTNTWFKLPPRRLYTWTSPQHTENRVIRNQIDYILVNKRYHSAVISAKTYPGTDINSDHNPVVVKVRPRWKIIKKQRPKDKLDMQLLKNGTTQKTVHEELNKNLGSIEQHIITESVDVNVLWKAIKDRINNVTEKHTKATPRRNKQEWMTEEILQLMDKRRESKGRNGKGEDYKRLNNLIRKRITEAKEKWLETKCIEIEVLQQKHDFFNLHKKVKEFTSTNKKITTHTMINTNGRLIDTTEDKLKEWENYIKILFDDIREDANTSDINNEGPKILKAEIQNAIKQLKTNKSPGPDGIYPEMLKLINEGNIEIFVSLYNRIYDSGKIPQDWLESIFIPLPKKPNPQHCNEFRLISLMSHAVKVLLKVVHNRIYRKCESIIGNDQFGFRAGMGTREALFNLLVLAQKCYDQQKDIFICFIDFEKAFDRVRHDLLLERLKEVGLDGKDIRLLENLYWNQKARIRIEGSTSAEVEIRRGVRQGCVLSPLLFNLYSEFLFKEALEDSKDGVKVNGVNINSIRYADDTVLIADCDLGLQRLIDRTNSVCERFGMKINIKKTKVMSIRKNQNVPQPCSIDGQILEQVNKFKYLGCWIDSSLNPELEVRSRIEQARKSFVKIKKLLCDSRIKLETRLRLSKCYVWSTLLYAAETWTLKTSTLNKLEAFEMWTYRRILKISWTSHTTNEEILRRIGIERELLNTVKVRKTSYLGHILRNNKYQYAQLIVKGKIEGKRGLGRKKLSWLRNIRQWTGLNFEQLIRTAEDREEFAIVVTNLH